MGWIAEYTVDDTANDLVNPSRLEAEVIALDLQSADYCGITVVGPKDETDSDILIHWSVELSSGDKTSLDNAIAAHTGAACYCGTGAFVVAGTELRASSFSGGAITWEEVT